ncbi:MAG TPA: OmpW family outer membrane protein [Caulobacteraceae bacterium]|nr:OmpW family outer membrane protein [Caulobacteraceae bacterium]
MKTILIVKRAMGAGACAAALGLASGPAHAQDYLPHAGTVVVRVGAAGVLFQSSGKLAAFGQPIPGAGLHLSDNVTAAFEGEYFVRPDLSITLAVGAPPTTNATATGTLAAVGKLGSVQYGPAALLGRYHVNQFGRFQPFVGAGVTRMLNFHDTGAAIPDLHVAPAWGAVVQAGGDYMLDAHWGVYGSISHLFLRTHAHGDFAGLPVTAKIALDPNVVQGGLAYRF